MKENVTHFDLEAAFKALDEIDIPVVKGGIRPNRIDLSENMRGRKLKTDLLVEDYYNINDVDDMELARDERQNEIAQAKLARIEKIVDLDAESPEDILPSYVGKYIIQCPQCMTLFYKDEADVVPSDDDPKTVNVTEVCQHCGNDTGYMLIGKVGEAEEPAEDVAAEEIPAEETAEEPAEAPAEEQNAEEVPEESNEDSAEDVDLTALGLDDSNNEETDEANEDEDEEKKESLNVAKAAEIDHESENKSENVTLNEDTDMTVDDAAEDTGDFDDYLDQYIEDGCWYLNKYGRYELFRSTKEAEKQAYEIIDAMPKFLAKQNSNQSARRTAARGGKVGSRSKVDGKELKVIMGEDGYEVVAVDPVKNEDVNILSGNSVGNGDSNLNLGGEAVSAIASAIPLMADNAGDKKLTESAETDVNAFMNSYDDVENIINKNVEESINTTVHTSEETSENVSENKTLNEKANEDEVVEDEVAEDEETAEIEAQADETEEVVAEVAFSQDEVKEVVQEVAEEIKGEELSEEEVEVVNEKVDEKVDEKIETEESDDEATDIDLEDVDDVDEIEIEECVSKSLSDVYENVENFKVNECSYDGKKFVVEGVINFKSGNSRNTAYVFDKAIRKDNNIKFIGMNESLANNGKFILNANIQNKNIIAEALNYKYEIDGSVVEG